MKLLISEETNEMLDKLVQQGFILNRIWDRGLSVLNVKYAMNNFEKIFHEGFAHLFPIAWSDTISNIQSMYNVTTKYLPTPLDDSDYNSPREFFYKNLKYHEETYNILVQAMKVANEHGDYNVSKELGSFMRTFNKFMEQSILLVDKANAVKNDDWFTFDYMCDKFFVFDGGDD